MVENMLVRCVDKNSVEYSEEKCVELKLHEYDYSK